MRSYSGNYGHNSFVLPEVCKERAAGPVSAEETQQEDVTRTPLAARPGCSHGLPGQQNLLLAWSPEEETS